MMMSGVSLESTNMRATRPATPREASVDWASVVFTGQEGAVCTDSACLTPPKGAAPRYDDSGFFREARNLGMAWSFYVERLAIGQLPRVGNDDLFAGVKAGENLHLVANVLAGFYQAHLGVTISDCK